MMKLFTGAAVTASALAMALSPAAMASGGKLFGGGATGGGGGTTTTTTTTASGGGGGGGGGGVNSGGVKDTSTTTAPATACASLTNVSAPTGYYGPTAVWNDFSLKNCSSAAENLSVRVTNTNQLTGSVDYDVTIPYTLSGGQGTNAVLDNDFAPYSTTYDVNITVQDASGNTLAAASTVATTPGPN
jgi:hypothetical protein